MKRNGETRQANRPTTTERENVGGRYSRLRRRRQWNEFAGLLAGQRSERGGCTIAVRKPNGRPTRDLVVNFAKTEKGERRIERRTDGRIFFASLPKCQAPAAEIHRDGQQHERFLAGISRILVLFRVQTSRFWSQAQDK